MIDPASVMTAISGGLTLVDQFVGIVRGLRGEKRHHRVEANQEQDSVVIRRDGSEVERVKANDLRLNEWDSARFDALKQRVSALWAQFNGIYAQLPSVSVDERLRLEGKMEGMRRELCKDFREMIRISEEVLGVGLDDHYTLYDTCSDLQD